VPLKRWPKSSRLEQIAGNRGLSSSPMFLSTSVLVKVCACASLRNALAQIQVLSSDVPLEKLAEDTESQECLD
jgi:hypothetical protein